ncbi:ANTAR domain-containing protein [Cellulomonas sp. NPDC057328]|uniref:ANTAR domain-containing protein n=1 Tax=Cellulomonas sp. NPDC057328 TaxID=3346101 RepID=UPI00363369DE
MPRTPEPALPARGAPPDDTSDTTGALLDLVLRLGSVEEQLAEIATAAAATDPAVAACGITVRRGGRVQSVASSDRLAADVDELQYEAREGPCLESLASGELLVVDDYLADQRWPRYGAHAVAHGVRSSMSVPLDAAGTTVGALNSYAMEPGVFVDGLRDSLLAFAARAEAVVALALRQAEQSDLVEHLHQAMESRSVIDQALGILMAQQRCSADDAFDVLRRASQGRNRKVAEIAADIVSAVSGGPPRTGRFER